MGGRALDSATVRRNWFIAAVVIGVAAIVIAAVAMRLSDDGGEQSAEQWANAVCGSLSEWRDSIRSLADVSGAPLTADSLRDRLGDAEEATSDLVSELRELGPPDLEAGEEVEAQLDGVTGELESSFDDLKDSAEAAADAPPSEFLGALAALASDFAALQTAIGATVAALQDADVAADTRAELDDAFSDAPDCQSLRDDSENDG